MLPAGRFCRGSLAKWPSTLHIRDTTPRRHASSLQAALAGTNYPVQNETGQESSLMKALTLPVDGEENVVPSSEHTVRTPPSELLQTLDSRGLVNQIVGSRGHFSKLTADPETFKCGVYVGIDPTAPSLHIGHLLPLMALYWTGSLGFDTVALVGDATAGIGDPTGRTTSRPVLSRDEIKSNTRRICEKLHRMSDNARSVRRSYSGEAQVPSSRHTVLTNSKWLHELSLMVSLRELGSAFRIGAMLSRDTARTKVASKEGMSLSEFMYPVLQAHDWLHLRKTRKVHIQIGGSDQYGNIISGSNAVWSAFQNRLPSYKGKERDLIHSGPAGMTVPLLTTSSGAKFGKSAGNAVWLDPDFTDPFDFYTYFVGVSDEDVGHMLKIFTFLPLENVDEVMESHNLDRSKRIAQHELAKQVTNLVHGTPIANRMSMLHSLMFQPITREGLRAFVAAFPNVKEPSDKKSDKKDKKADKKGDNEKNDSPIVNKEGVVVTIRKSSLDELPPARLLGQLGFENIGSVSAASRLIAAGGVYIGCLPSAEGASDEDAGEVVTFKRFKDVGLDSAAEWEKFMVEGVLLVRSGKKGFRIIHVI
ncbi:hypothetical protein P152DRAFT_407275 [Eremomyces bilateralis CBS 781.70]|uniref:Tyrosine--tRNA ligase n=1 Tax=Eremomyces bilateralis CBS 781.70 TaxID=1392243 RepID=A0A6G1GGG0_9PEZI|nr:uncharacterized protein P152DRAFT_407275 [Eremomyces bilateralis CBS 781.70]KAF1817016.1 hypothetical protein P152DRAFT_407275 [Eremomyces bilateralis CBS 781.70]